MAFNCKFVDSIAASPGLRLNLHDGSLWRVAIEGTEMPPPPLNRAIASTLLVDGAVIPSSAYDLRSVRLRLWVNAGSADLVATELQKLYRELDRPVNILQWQLETTNPLFFRTFRSSPDVVRPTGMMDGKWQEIEVELLAEPFAYGLREDPISSLTVNFDPAAGSNGAFLDVTGVKGDVETPVKMVFPSSLTGISWLAVRRRGTPSSTPFLLQAESCTVGADTTTQANDAAFSGSSNNWTRTTFATLTTLTTRLTKDPHPATPSVDVRGTYRVVGRMRKTVSGDTITVQVSYGNNIVSSKGVVTLQSGTNLQTVDFGLISIPASQDPVVDMVTGTEIAAAGTAIKLAAGRSGTGNLDVDFLLLVPADDRLAIVDWGTIAPTTDWALDGVSETVYGRDASGRVVTTTEDSSYIGGAPMLTPNQTNRIYWLYQVPSSNTAISTTTSISLSYYPRYLTVRPAST